MHILQIVLVDKLHATYVYVYILFTCIFRPCCSRSVAAYSHQTFPLSVGRSVCPEHCGKTADRIRMPSGIIARTGPWRRQVVGFGDRSTGRGTFGDEFGARGVRVRQLRDAALFPNYFEQTC